MTTLFRRAYPPAELPAGAYWWLPFCGPDVVVREDDGQAALLYGGMDVVAGLEFEPPVLLGSLDGVPCVSCQLSSTAELPTGWHAIGLRELYGKLDDALYEIAGYAAHLLLWQRTSRFCPVCASSTEPMQGDWGRRCSKCGHTRYPQLSPAILALVHDGDRVLLTHKPGWSARYSIIAGFVEPGESLEACVQREVEEEVGVAVANISYVGSQPWPFPDQLMIGYMAEYAGGMLEIDTAELDDAAWFHVDALPELPPPMSLSRRIIDAWAASRRRELLDGQSSFRA